MDCQKPTIIVSAQGYEASLRQYHLKMLVDGQLVESVVDEPALRPGINAAGLTYDYDMHKIARLHNARRAGRDRFAGSPVQAR